MLEDRHVERRNKNTNDLKCGIIGKSPYKIYIEQSTMIYDLMKIII